jgi:hypothetical protein
MLYCREVRLSKFKGLIAKLLYSAHMVQSHCLRVFRAVNKQCQSKNNSADERRDYKLSFSASCQNSA